MSRLIAFLARQMMPWAMRVSDNSYMQALRDAFAMLLPFVLVASFFGVAAWVFLDPWGTVLGRQGLDLGAVLTGLDTESMAYKESDFVRALQIIQGLCHNVVTVGFDLFSLLLALALAYRLGVIWQGEPIINALTAMGAFVIVTPQTVGAGIPGLELEYLGNKAVLTAIAVSTISSWLFIRLSRNKHLQISMPESVPATVAKSFSVLLPVLIVLWVFTLLATFIAHMDFMGSRSFNDLLYALIQSPLMGFSQGLGFALLYQGITWSFWWLGIHGHHVTTAVQHMVYMPVQLANQAGEGAYIFTNGFFEAGIMQVMGLLLAILIFSSRPDWRAVAKMSLPAMFFNIQEPLLFGLPIVLNPLLLIPYILAPLVNTVVSWLALTAGLVPLFKYVVPWTMPAFFGGLLGTGSLAGGILQIFLLVLDIFIYAPFVMAAGKIKTDTDKDK